MLKLDFYFSLFCSFCFFSRFFCFFFFVFSMWSQSQVFIFILTLLQLQVYPSLWNFCSFFLKPIMLLLVYGKEIFCIFSVLNVLRIWCGSKVWRETKWLVYGDNGVWFFFHKETCGKKNVFGRCKGCSY